MGLLADVYEVLEKHGYQRPTTNKGHADTLIALLHLVEAFVDEPDPRDEPCAEHYEHGHREAVPGCGACGALVRQVAIGPAPRLPGSCRACGATGSGVQRVAAPPGVEPWECRPACQALIRSFSPLPLEDCDD